MCLQREAGCCSCLRGAACRPATLGSVCWGPRGHAGWDSMRKGCFLTGPWLGGWQKSDSPAVRSAVWWAKSTEVGNVMPAQQGCRWERSCKLMWGNLSQSCSLEVEFGTQNYLRVCMRQAQGGLFREKRGPGLEPEPWSRYRTRSAHWMGTAGSRVITQF